MAGNVRSRVLSVLQILTRNTDEDRTLTTPEMPNIPDALLERVATLGRKFNEKLSCDVEMNLTPHETITLKGNREPLSLDERVELYRSWYGMDSATDQQLATRANRDDEAERSQESYSKSDKWRIENGTIVRI